jgi:hypothetical protein
MSGKREAAPIADPSLLLPIRSYNKLNRAERGNVCEYSIIFPTEPPLTFRRKWQFGAIIISKYCVYEADFPPATSDVPM